MTCKYRGKMILDSGLEQVFECVGYQARDLNKKPCDNGGAHYDSLLNLCRVRKEMGG